MCVVLTMGGPRGAAGILAQPLGRTPETVDRSAMLEAKVRAEPATEVPERAWVWGAMVEAVLVARLDWVCQDLVWTSLQVSLLLLAWPVG